MILKIKKPPNKHLIKLPNMYLLKTEKGTNEPNCTHSARFGWFWKVLDPKQFSSYVHTRSDFSWLPNPSDFQLRVLFLF
jgi:hypothetical protein